ncbi:MAG: GntR family transcriptional regulator [Proteobacteria bacterium]|nr:GntR family transcriptional regulator [Pseudomonadota bacterium]
MAIIRKTTYKDQVIEHVYELILDGSYFPGDHIKESLLAKDLGISRAPVREALKELIVNGIVDYKPQVGNFIALLSAKQIADSYTTRGILEGYALMDTRIKFNNDDLKELESLVDSMRKYAKQDNKKMVVQVGHEFHTLLVSKNTNIQLAKYMDRLSLKLHVMFCKHWSDLYTPEEIGDRHMQIVTSLMSGDPIGIETTVRNHYSESGNKIAAIYKVNGRRNE